MSMTEQELDDWFESSLQRAKGSAQEKAIRHGDHDQLDKAARFVSPDDGSGMTWHDHEDWARREWDGLSRDEKQILLDRLNTEPLRHGDPHYELHFWEMEHALAIFADPPAEPSADEDPGGGKPSADEDPDGGWSAGVFAVGVTLPDGSTYAESDAGNSIDGVAVNVDADEKVPPWWKTPRGAAGLVAGSLAGVAAIVLISLLAGSGDSEDSQVAEPGAAPVTEGATATTGVTATTTIAATTTVAATTTTALAATTLAPSTTLSPTTIVTGPRDADPPSGAQADLASTIEEFLVLQSLIEDDSAAQSFEVLLGSDAASLAALAALLGVEPEEDTSADGVFGQIGAGEFVFLTKVRGEGRSQAMAPSTKWYLPIFGFSTCEGTAYEVQGEWGRGNPFEGEVFDENFDPVEGSTVDGAWLTENIFAMELTLALPPEGSGEQPCGFDGVDVELLVRVEDADGISTDFGDQLTWPACCNDD